MIKSPGTVISYTTEPDTYTKKCPNSTLHWFQLDTLDEITLDPHCQVELPSFMLLPPNSLEDKACARTFSWTLNLNHTLWGMDPKYLDKVLKSASEYFIPP